MRLALEDIKIQKQTIASQSTKHKARNPILIPKKAIPFFQAPFQPLGRKAIVISREHKSKRYEPKPTLDHNEHDSVSKMKWKSFIQLLKNEIGVLLQIPAIKCDMRKSKQLRLILHTLAQI